jgi:membrane fusion protein (multidrug efflux system)
VRARITTDVRENAVAVPKRAIVPEAGANFVFVAEADTVRKVEVVTGYSDDEHIEIVKGVSLDEAVVVVGQGGLRNGSRIRDLNAPQTASPEKSEASTDEAERVASLGD